MKKPKKELSSTDLEELDKKLHELALLDFALFCKLAGVDKMQAFVCFELKRGKSYRQIGIKLSIGKNVVYAVAKKCPEKKDSDLKK